MKALFLKYYNKTATAEERSELMEKIHGLDDHALADLIQSAGEGLSVVDRVIDEDKAALMLQHILPKPVSRLYRAKWWLSAAAAALLILLAGGYWLITHPKKPAEITAIHATNDVRPGHAAAVLTLGDGTKVPLDSAANGRVIRQGKTTILNKDNQLVYSASAEKEVAMNTLTTARGQTYVTVLADGSKVWLNAASSLSYPVVFGGSERRVTVTGEAYFEVAHDASRPFHVMVNGGEVTVLGTHFNINAYPEEGAPKVTLLEGSIQLNAGQKTVVIKPGEQAALEQGIPVTENINTDAVVAWKEGWFHFEQAGLQDILRQFSRWYDIDVVYENPVSNRKFFGIVKRSKTLLNVLGMLKDNNIGFRIEGKKLIVTSE